MSKHASDPQVGTIDVFMCAFLAASALELGRYTALAASCVLHLSYFQGSIFCDWPRFPAASTSGSIAKDTCVET